MNSSNESAKARHVAPASSGQICGIVTRQKTSQRVRAEVGGRLLERGVEAARAPRRRSAGSTGTRRRGGRRRPSSARGRCFTRTKNDEQRDADEQAGQRHRQEEQQRERRRAAGARAAQPVRGHRAEHERDDAGRRRPRSGCSRARRGTPGRTNTSRYQRSEKPSNGNESAPVVWNENSTTTASGTYRKTQRRDRDTPATGLRGRVHQSRTRTSVEPQQPQAEHASATYSATNAASIERCDGRGAQRPSCRSVMKLACICTPSIDAARAAEELRRHVVRGRQHEDEQERVERPARRRAAGSRAPAQRTRPRRGPARASSSPGRIGPKPAYSTSTTYGRKMCTSATVTAKRL